MSFTLIMVVTAAVAASAGYLAARRKESPSDDVRPKDDAPPEGGKGKVERKPEVKAKPAGKAKSDDKEARAKAQQKVFEDLPLSLGDVVSAFEEERWLSGALVAREDGQVLSVLFLAPEGATLAAVAVFAPPRKDIYWMSPAELASPEEPPATIELDGVPFRRKGRLPVTIERLGQGAPPMGPEAIWGAYEGGKGEVAVVITSQGVTHAWMGRRLGEDEYDRMGAG